MARPKFTDEHRFQRRPYDPSHATDIRKRFDAVMKETKKEQQRSEEIIKEAESIVAKTRIKGKAA